MIRQGQPKQQQVFIKKEITSQKALSIIHRSCLIPAPFKTHEKEIFEQLMTISILLTRKAKDQLNLKLLGKAMNPIKMGWPKSYLWRILRTGIGIPRRQQV
jgi:hypothetical protein